MKRLLIGMIILVGVFMVGSIAMANITTGEYPSWSDSTITVPAGYPSGYKNSQEVHEQTRRTSLFIEYSFHNHILPR